MEQIPTEVMEKINQKVTLHLAIVTNDEIIINPKKHKLLTEFAEFGYRLASPCALCEGKDLSQLLHDVQQILSAYAMDETWSEWDESVRKRVIELQYKLQDNGNSK